MNKAEAIKLIKQQKGYIPYAHIFELFDDFDNIPQELLSIAMQKEVKDIIVSPKLAALLEELQEKKEFL